MKKLNGFEVQEFANINEHSTCSVILIGKKIGTGIILSWGCEHNINRNHHSKSGLECLKKQRDRVTEEEKTTERVMCACMCEFYNSTKMTKEAKKKQKSLHNKNVQTGFDIGSLVEKNKSQQK